MSYARFSTERQSSVQDQHRVNDALAVSHGVRLLQHFSDEAQSRSLSERRGLNDLLVFLREHDEVRYIVVNELALCISTAARTDHQRVAHRGPATSWGY